MEPQANGALIRAAEYVRMSTDDQKYSPESQSETNGEYAAAHDMLIVRTYLDGGRSGLNFDRRDGLRQLIEDVLTGKADFKAILVLDVSRWGRFQDPDESGYYEYTCKLAGIMVHYTAEQFENDGTPIAAVIKVLKRAMAGEYSRELSVKVFNGQRRLINLGYRQGASAGYGLRRLLVDQNGVAKGTLKRGELKSIQSDRVLLIPGPPDELDIVRLIFRLFVAQKKNAGAIASLLNQREIRNVKGGRWKRHHVRHVLKNENYIGNVVWNRQSAKLKGKIVNNDRDKWVRVPDGAVAPSLRSADKCGGLKLCGSPGLAHDPSGSGRCAPRYSRVRVLTIATRYPQRFCGSPRVYWESGSGRHSRFRASHKYRAGTPHQAGPAGHSTSAGIGMFQNNAAMASLTASEITAIIAEATLEIAQQKGMTDSARICLVFEEAHTIIPEWNSVASDGDRAATAATSRAILQGRKYGLGCVLITQRTANVTKTILNQCNTIFAMRTFDDTGREFLSNYIGSDYASVLPSLAPRHAVLFGKASSCEDPVLIRLNDRVAFTAAFRAENPPRPLPQAEMPAAPVAAVAQQPDEEIPF